MSGPAGDRRQDGHLVAVGDGSRQLNRFAVEPNPAVGRHGRKLLAVANRGHLQDLAHGGRRDLVSSRASGIPGRGEKSENSHQQSRNIDRRGKTADPAR
jgi:hypothetical protein